jgi:hypothetical protein
MVLVEFSLKHLFVLAGNLLQILLVQERNDLYDDTEDFPYISHSSILFYST